MDPLPSKPDNKFSNSGGISILDDPRYESSISGPENIMPSMPVNSRPFPGTSQGEGTSGGLGGLLGESGGGPSIPTLTGTGESQKAIEDPNNPGSLMPILTNASNNPAYIGGNQNLIKSPGLPRPGNNLSFFGNIMQATPSTGDGPSLTQTADPAREAYDKLQASVREQRKINPYTRDVLYGEKMKFEDFKKSYDAGTDPNQPTYSGPQLQNQLQSSGGGLKYLGGGLYDSMNSRKEPARGSLQQLADGGIAGLRQGYAGGSLVDKGRRGFLKFLGGQGS
jgi:hypothetical protein